MKGPGDHREELDELRELEDAQRDGDQVPQDPRTHSKAPKSIEIQAKQLPRSC